MKFHLLTLFLDEMLFQALRSVMKYGNMINSFMMMSLSYRNQSFDLHYKSMNWFLYDREASVMKKLRDRALGFLMEREETREIKNQQFII